jgi:hypothetical protein
MIGLLQGKDFLRIFISVQVTASFNPFIDEIITSGINSGDKYTL